MDYSEYYYHGAKHLVRDSDDITVYSDRSKRTVKDNTMPQKLENIVRDALSRIPAEWEKPTPIAIHYENRSQGGDLAGTHYNKKGVIVVPNSLRILPSHERWKDSELTSEERDNLSKVRKLVASMPNDPEKLREYLFHLCPDKVESYFQMLESVSQFVPENELRSVIIHELTHVIKQVPYRDGKNTVWSWKQWAIYHLDPSIINRLLIITGLFTVAAVVGKAGNSASLEANDVLILTISIGIFAAFYWFNKNIEKCKINHEIYPNPSCRQPRLDNFSAAIDNEWEAEESMVQYASLEELSSHREYTKYLISMSALRERSMMQKSKRQFISTKRGYLKSLPSKVRQEYEKKSELQRFLSMPKPHMDDIERLKFLDKHIELRSRKSK